jgi:hypothetical protein
MAFVPLDTNEKGPLSPAFQKWLVSIVMGEAILFILME